MPEEESFKSFRCSSNCTAGTYDMHKLVSCLISKGLEPKYFDDVVYAQKKLHHPDHVIELFFFDFGCVVVWGGNEGDESLVIKDIEMFDKSFVTSVTSDMLYYRYDDTSQQSFINEENNEVVIHDKYDVFTKLSMSYAFAQSIKLTTLERSVEKLLKQTAPLQKELATTGKVGMSKRQISKQIGRLFSERYLINMHSDILDTPECFWRRPNYEPLYLMAADFQDIQVRQNILNHRLSMIHELYSILSNELNYKHSTRLELIVIALIGIEVVTGVLDNEFLYKTFIGI